MSNEITTGNVIEIPSYLSNANAGIATAACNACEYWLCTGCEAEQDDPCTSQCYETTDCGNCEGSSQSCGSGESTCSMCQGLGGCEAACEAEGQTCGTCMCVSVQECSQSCGQGCSQGCGQSAWHPEDWAWATKVVSGGPVGVYNHNPSYLTAAEWNAFTSRINEFRSYKSYGATAFTPAAQGEPMLDSQIQEAIAAITEMRPPLTTPKLSDNEYANCGGYSASFFNGLAASLNSLTGSYITANDYYVGSSVYLIEDNLPVEYIVVHKGNPNPDIYDSSFDGVWLLRKEIYKILNSYTRTFPYFKTALHSCINDELYPSLDNYIKTAIKQVHLPYVSDFEHDGTGNHSVEKATVYGFALAAEEIGWSSSNPDDFESDYANGEGAKYYIPKDGSCLDYFASATAADRIANYYEENSDWVLRSPHTNSYPLDNVITEYASFHTVNKNGRHTCTLYFNDVGVRPCFVIKSDTLFNPTTNVIVGWDRSDGEMIGDIDYITPANMYTYFKGYNTNNFSWIEDVGTGEQVILLNSDSRLVLVAKQAMNLNISVTLAAYSAGADLYIKDKNGETKFDSIAAGSLEWLDNGARYYSVSLMPGERISLFHDLTYTDASQWVEGSTDNPATYCYINYIEIEI